MSWDPHTLDELHDAFRIARASSEAADLPMTLYERWWAAPRPVATSPGRWDPPLGWALRAAHAGALEWSPAEHRVLMPAAFGTAVVDGRGRRRALGRGDYLTIGAGGGLAPIAGSRLRISRRLGAHDDHGWWRTWGEGWPARRSSAAGLTRLYFAPRRVQVAMLVHEITRVVPRIGDVWSLKVATAPASLDRADAVVLYLPDIDRDHAFAEFTRHCAEFVRNARPPFSEELAPGISWAEDPGTGHSFGELRCQWLTTAYRRAARSAAGFADGVAKVFSEHGVRADAPHLRSPEELP